MLDSKERVKIALSHQEPDRIPINFRATELVTQQLSRALDLDYWGILERFRVDFREVIPTYVGPTFPDKRDGSKVDMWGVGRHVHNSEKGNDFLISYSPLQNASVLEDIQKHHWPRVEWFDFSEIKSICNQFKGYAISTPGIHVEGHHGVFHLMTYLFGFEKVMVDLALNPELVRAAIDRVMAFLVSYYDQFFKSAKGMIDFLFYKDDFGSQDSLLISRDMFLNFFFPNLKTLADLASSYGVKLILHSCGSILPLIPDFINAGVCVLDPIQVTAKGMDIRVLKGNYGKQLTFHGGIDVQRLMPFGTIEEIKFIAKETMEILGKDGGYFFGPSHRFQVDTPVGNIVTLYETALDHGFYA
ncbi:MAG: hypothetical protein FJ110_13735 [Deltaproteobacteria bacterium]|nr:hypothetical protein [Deltaproteobacteria bacterium]